jgi:hypothetical protein
VRAPAVDRDAALYQLQQRPAAGIFADGITEDLTTDLSPITGSFVKEAASSVFINAAPFLPSKGRSLSPCGRKASSDADVLESDCDYLAVRHHFILTRE